MEIHEMTFEQALQELERVVTRLENEALSLEEALALYKKGVALFEHCRSRLQEAEGWVKQALPTSSGFELRPLINRQEWEAESKTTEENNRENDEVVNEEE